MSDETIERPTREQIDEVVDPTLSRDSFSVGDQKFPIQILPYSVEKKVLLALNPLLRSLGESKPQSVWDLVSSLNGETLSQYGDVLMDVVGIICRYHSPKVSPDFIIENLCVADAIKIVLEQFQKNKLGDIVSHFFLAVAKMMPMLQKSQPNSGN
jgi:hypothetical protein